MKKTNFDKVNIKDEQRVELHDKLNLTGAEISVNNLPAKNSVPFVHSHKQNEEIYIILDGQGYAKIDEETIDLKKNDCVRISPKAKRQFFTSDNSNLKYICIQVKENSLNEFTINDAIVY